MAIEKGKILLVDDDEDVLLAAKFLLKRHFALIDTANSPRKAVDLLNKNKFDVVLLDIKMPRMDGMETLMEIKKYNLS